MSNCSLKAFKSHTLLSISFNLYRKFGIRILVQQIIFNADIRVGDGELKANCEECKPARGYY